MRRLSRRRILIRWYACDRRGVLPCWSFPRIDQHHARRFEIHHIARNDGQAVNKRGRGDESVAFGSRVGNVKLRTALRDGRINGEDSILEPSQNLTVDPSTQDSTLRCVFAPDQARTKFDFQNRDSGHEEARRRDRVCPCDDIAISFVWPPQFGNDIGVQQKHQSRSAGLKIPPSRRGGLKSNSASVCANASARLMCPPVRRK